MSFIWMLILAAITIAGAAEFFSVYGLAHTFSGVFWSVVIMGGALGFGKLVGLSFLYRYWKQTPIVLRTYLTVGIISLMILTSVGIFGYMSAGYQQDSLPLKQMNEQITLLQGEKDRLIDRKKQIDDLLAKAPAISATTNKNGEIDPNATRAINAATRAREQANAQYKVEQREATQRITELDKQLLTLKQQQIATNVHIGPITYIAEAFGLSPDNATKYLVLMIIFVFDPMAVALTLAANIAIRIREEEKKKPNDPTLDQMLEKFDPEKHNGQEEPARPVMEYKVEEATPEMKEAIDFLMDDEPSKGINMEAPLGPSATEWTQEKQDELKEVLSRYYPVDENDKRFEAATPAPEQEVVQAVTEDVPVTKEVIEQIPEAAPSAEEPKQSEPPLAPQPAPTNDMTHVISGMDTSTGNKIMELLQHYRALATKQSDGYSLNETERWELSQLRRLLHDKGFAAYLD